MLGNPSRREFLKGAVSLGALTLASACVPSTPSAVAPGATAAPAAAVPSKELVTAYTADLNTMDPALVRGPNEHENALHMYNGLVRYVHSAPNVQVEPDLAQSWDISPDGKVWTFKLRQGVQFHKEFGEFTSDDVVFHFNRLRDPNVGSQAISDVAPIENIEAPDKYTVRFTMKAPYQNFLEAVLAWRWALIPSRKAIEKYGADFPNNPTGTGPYQFDSRVPRQEILYTLNPSSFRKVASISKIKMVVIPEESAAGLALRSGQVLAMKVQDPAVFRSLGSDSNAQLAADPAMSWLGLFFNSEVKPLDDVRVRQALANAIDRTAMVAAMDNMAVPAYSIIPPAGFGHTTDVPKHDGGVAKAKQLLADAGYANGFSIEVTTRQEHHAYCQVAADQWRQIGVATTIKLLESGAFAAVASAPEHNYMAIAGGIGRPTAEQQLVQFNSRSPRINNYAAYKNPKVDGIIDQLAVELDQEKRKALLGDFQRTVAEEVPALVMLNQFNVVGYHKSVQNYARNFVNHLIIAEQMTIT